MFVQPAPAINVLYCARAKPLYRPSQGNENLMFSFILAIYYINKLYTQAQNILIVFATIFTFGSKQLIKSDH